MPRKGWLLSLVLGVLAFGSIWSATALGDGKNAADSPIAYPKSYREWTHVKSMVIQEGHSLFGAFGGIHHLYANEKALAGYRSGRFENGSVIVFDLLESVSTDGALTEGGRRVLGVMQRDARRFAATGGWGFEGFGGGDPGKRVVGANARTACFDCHASAADHQFVFSRWRP